MNVDNKKYWYRGISNLVIVLLLTFEYRYIWLTRLNILMHRPFEGKGNILIYAVYIVITILVVKVFDGFKMGVNRISHIIISQWLAMIIVNVITLIENYLMIGDLHKTIEIFVPFSLLLLCQFVSILIVTYVLTKLYRVIFPPLRILMICGEHINNLDYKMNLRDDKYFVEDTISCSDDIEYISEKIKEYDAIVLNDVDSSFQNAIIKECYKQNMRVYFTPKIHDILVKNAEELHLFDTPLYLCRNLGLTFSHRLFKRISDIILSLLGIVIFSPIMLITAIAIRVYDGGPAIYKQTRLTKDNKPFQIKKFRSMIINAEQDGIARLANENDKRITPVGKIIRATRIDELPQLFNILHGDMSLVGPRPERPEIIEEYIKEIPEFEYRTRVKAGLTGYAQVYGKYNTTNLDKLKLDIIYVERGTILLDIKLILLTLKVIFLKDSTEGLEEGMDNASVGKLGDGK